MQQQLLYRLVLDPDHDLPAISIALHCFIHYSYPSATQVHYSCLIEIFLLLFEYIEYIELKYTQNSEIIRLLVNVLMYTAWELHRVL